MTNLDNILKSRDIIFSQSYVFSSSRVWMWESDYKESWVPKNWCFWIVVSEKTLESPLDCKEVQPVNSKGNQPWIFIGRTNAEAETSILWPPDVENWLIGKDPDAGKNWRQEEKGTTEDVQAQHTHWSLSATLPLHHCYKMGFSRQGYWVGLPFPPPGDLPNPGIEPESPVPPA